MLRNFCIALRDNECACLRLWTLTLRDAGRDRHFFRYDDLARAALVVNREIESVPPGAVTWCVLLQQRSITRIAAPVDWKSNTLFVDERSAYEMCAGEPRLLNRLFKVVLARLRSDSGIEERRSLDRVDYGGGVGTLRRSVAFEDLRAIA